MYINTIFSSLLKAETHISTYIFDIIELFNNSDAILNFEHIAVHCGTDQVLCPRFSRARVSLRQIARVRFARARFARVRFARVRFARVNFSRHRSGVTINAHARTSGMYIFYKKKDREMQNFGS